MINKFLEDVTDFSDVWQTTMQREINIAHARGETVNSFLALIMKYTGVLQTSGMWDEFSGIVQSMMDTNGDYIENIAQRQENITGFLQALKTSVYAPEATDDGE